MLYLQSKEIVEKRVAENLISIRKVLFMTGTELGKEFGVTKQQISLLEKNISKLSGPLYKTYIWTMLKYVKIEDNKFRQFVLNMYMFVLFYMNDDMYNEYLKSINQCFHSTIEWYKQMKTDDVLEACKLMIIKSFPENFYTEVSSNIDIFNLNNIISIL